MQYVSFYSLQKYRNIFYAQMNHPDTRIIYVYKFLQKNLFRYQITYKLELHNTH